MKDASNHLDDLKEKLIERKYPSDLVNKQVARAKSKDRRCQIFQSNNKQIQNDKVRLIFTHNEKNPPIHQWIWQCRTYLDRNEKAKEMGQNIQIAYKQPINLKKIVGGPKNGGGGHGGRNDADSGCFKCKKKMSCLQNLDWRENIQKH